MHLYFVARGGRMWIRRYVEMLETVFLPAKTEKGDGMLQLVPREVKLYEMAFPEEHLDKVLEIMKPSIYNLLVEKIMNFFRYLTGVPNKRIQKACEKNTGLTHPHVGVHVIGVVKDKKNKEGKEII